MHTKVILNIFPTENSRVEAGSDAATAAASLTSILCPAQQQNRTVENRLV